MAHDECVRAARQKLKGIVYCASFSITRRRDATEYDSHVFIGRRATYTIKHVKRLEHSTQIDR